jgi:AraC-like DNA-binding protein
MFLASLRQSIVRLLPQGDMSIDKVAGELNVSRRTLQRRLSDRDTQFLQVLKEIRADLSVRYLGDERLGIAEIAFLLGYSDQGSFSSAFKIWHGQSPRDYRLR